MARSASQSADLGQGAGAYLRLLRYPPAARPFLAALVARLPLAMAPLGMLLLVQSERSAYGIAGLVTGAYAAGSAVGTPLWGRLMDRFGQIRVLRMTSLVCAGLLVALTRATLTGAPTPVLMAIAASAGFSYPPMSPALRSAWRVVFPDLRERRVAFALDSTSVELVFVGGPLLLSLLLLVGPPAVPLLVTAGLMAGGTVGYTFTTAARRSGPRVPEPVDPELGRLPGGRTALGAPGVLAVLVVMLMLSIGFGQLDTSMAATAGLALGGTDRVGILFTAIAGGSTVGGLVYGARSWRFEERRAVPALLLAFALLLGSLALMLGLGRVHLTTLLPLLFLTGLTIAPTLIMQQGLLDHLTPSHRITEAQAFLSAANTTGAAAGTAVAGFLIDLHGIGWSFGGAAIGAAAAALIALRNQTSWHRASAEVEPERVLSRC